MSRWTYVTGCLSVETYTEDKDIKGYVENLLEKAPKITGSEQDCDIFVNPLSGYNTWVGMDCDHCGYKDKLKPLSDNTFFCGKDKDYKCPEAEYQTCVAITLVGRLRDKGVDETKKEVEDFIRYLQGLDAPIDINNCSIFVEDEFEGGYQLKLKFLDRENILDKGEFVWNKV